MNIVDLWAGDDWELRFSLFNSDGTTPFDLTGSRQLWTMLDRLNHRLIQSDEVFYGLTDPSNGKISVFVPSTVTTRLQAAIRLHALRIISGGVTATPFGGQINVLVDPWAAAVAPATNVVNMTAKPARAGVDRAAGHGRVG